MKTETGKPVVYEYLDFREYLRDLLQWLRANRRGFSFQVLVDRYGLSSRAHFNDVLQGRTLTPRFVEAYVAICGLVGNEADYFRAIVRYAQASSAVEKQEAFSAVTNASLSMASIRLEDEAFRYFSRWYYPAMLALLECCPHENDHRVLASLLAPRISAVEARQALATLSELGFIEWDTNRTAWIFHAKHLSCTDRGRVAALQVFHAAMLQLGRDAYEKNVHAQFLSTLTVGVTPATRDTIRQMIIELRTRIMDLTKKESSPEDVLQINLQTFLLTQKPQKGRRRKSL